LRDDPTKELPQPSPFEAHVLAEFAMIREEFALIRGEQAERHIEMAAIRMDLAELNSRLTTLEDKVDVRLSETRPIWESVQVAIKGLDLKFDTVLKDLYEVRTNDRMHDRRLMQLEAR